METAKFVSSYYEKSDTIEMQGSRDEIEKYLKQGYYVKIERNGYRVLVKKARVMVTLENSKCTNSFNMKNEILDYYGKERISKQLVKKFEEDINNNKITFEMNEDGTYYNIK